MTIQPTVFEYRFPPGAVDLLPANQEAGGVGEVDVSRLGVVVDGPWVDQVLDGNHVLVAGLDVQIQAPNDPRTPLPVEQEEVVFGLCERQETQNRLWFIFVLVFFPPPLHTYCQLIGLIHQCCSGHYTLLLEALFLSARRSSPHPFTLMEPLTTGSDNSVHPQSRSATVQGRRQKHQSKQRQWLCRGVTCWRFRAKVVQRGVWAGKANRGAETARWRGPPGEPAARANPPEILRPQRERDK